MMEFHPVANIFPMMTEDEYRALVADIAEHGQREAIWTYCGQIIDGRNRYKACAELGIKPIVREWDGDEPELVSFIVSLNLHRRHLSESQRSMVAAKLANMPVGRHWVNSANLQNNNVSRGDAADMFNVSERSVNTAAKILKEAAQAVIEAVEQGHMPVSAAAKIVDASPEFQEDVARRVVSGIRPQEAIRQTRAERISENAPEAPSLKYRVVYADPPWSYSDSLTISKDGASESYGPARAHYPAMSIADLCALPVPDMCERDAVLFLWVTSPLLEDAFRVISAWGFDYKTSFVWDKVKHNMGHYNSVRHEFLLVCTRGSCTPDVLKLFDSVVSEERSDKHSEKPETFRNIIDTIYTRGKRIELFARNEAPGWDAWGNEVGRVRDTERRQ